MPVGQPSQSTPTYLGRIVTVDPTQRIIDVVLNASGARVQITTTPICSRWPIVGETWTIHFINNTPYLGEPYQQYQIGSGNSQIGIEEIPAGDVWINSPTGQVHVIGNPSGTTDFAFAKQNVLPSPPLTSNQVLQSNGTGGSFWGDPIVVPRGFAASNGAMAAGSGGPTSATALSTPPSLSITLSKQARIRLSGAWSIFTTVPNTFVTWYYQIDGGGYIAVDNFYLNDSGKHLKASVFVIPTASLTAGAHTISFGYSVVTGGSITTDSNDTYSVMAEEMFA